MKGIETVMLTGDNQERQQPSGKQVGVSDIKADLLPEDKLNLLKNFEKNIKVWGWSEMA